MSAQTAIVAILFLMGCLISSPAYLTESDTSPNSEIHKKLNRAAQGGSAVAQFELGKMFEYGKGVAQNDATAAQWYEKSAAQEFTDARYRLAVLYDNGWGVKADKSRAYGLFKSAANAGHELAQHDLAMMYFEGTGTTRDLLEAYKWLKIAILNGSSLMQKHLNRVSLEMTPEEITYANFLAEHWLSDGI